MYVYTYRALEGRLNIAPTKVAWNPTSVIATSGDIVPCKVFPVNRLQFYKQREKEAISLVSGAS